jgi:hypothetical protein
VPERLRARSTDSVAACMTRQSENVSESHQSFEGNHAQKSGSTPRSENERGKAINNRPQQAPRTCDASPSARPSHESELSAEPTTSRTELRKNRRTYAGEMHSRVVNRRATSRWHAASRDLGRAIRRLGQHVQDGHHQKAQLRSQQWQYTRRVRWGGTVAVSRSSRQVPPAAGQQ